MWRRGACVCGPGADVWDVVKIRVGDHLFGDSLTEFLYLFSDVDEERLGLPSSSKHDAPSFVSREH